MITSAACWLKEDCKKFNNVSKPCECRDSDVFCIKLFKIATLYEQALMSDFQRVKKVISLDSDRADYEAFTKLKDFSDINNIENNILQGKSLYIYSSITGNGKTLWAERICQSYINAIWHKADLSCKVLFVSVPRFLISMKNNITQQNDYFIHIRDNIQLADLVVWDDIATKDTSQFEHENLLSMIDNRVVNQKSNIYTSNILPENLEELVGPRLSSRIIGYSECIQFVGKDKRGVSR